jgi:hypothetical protein
MAEGGRRPVDSGHTPPLIEQTSGHDVTDAGTGAGHDRHPTGRLLN